MSDLIVGGTAKERLAKAQKVSSLKYQVSSFDTLLVEGETSIGIGQVRDLKHQLNLKPYNSAFKVAIIHPAELLTMEAQNALLKLLEEPNETSVLMLTAPQEARLLPTVVSRCQIIKLPAKAEIELTKEELKSIVQVLSSFLQAGAGERLKLASQIGKDREEIKEFLVRWLLVLREILWGKDELGLSKKQVVQIIKNLEKTLGLLEQNVNPRLALEVFLLDLPRINL